MEDLLDKISNSADAFKNLSKIKSVLDAHVAKVPKPPLPTENDSKELCQYLGLLPGQEPVEENIEAAKELVDCLILSADGGDDEEKAKRQKLDESDEEKKEAVAVEFERYDEDAIEVEEKSLETINQLCAIAGETYVDPQFSPENKSLYADHIDATSWQCGRCGKRTDYPPPFDMPTSQEEATMLQAKLDAIRCIHCGEKPTYVAQVQFMNRPCQWLRAAANCSLCDMIYNTQAYPNGNELKCRMCSHFLRDKLNHLTIGAPWKIIRESARPDDVVQGALGNCWFAGALSVCCLKEGIIEKLVGKDTPYNDLGAYEVKIFHSGIWRNLIIDDYFPTSKIFNGKFEGGKVYYSRGGELSYLQSERRQLWVPLVEKAGAKLFKSYQALGGGTFFEALSMFTGYPTETMTLSMSKAHKEHIENTKSRRAAARMQAMMRGQEPPSYDDDDAEIEELYDFDIQWTKLLSFKDEGYLMGMALTIEGSGKTKDELTELGLQAPHAYCILDLKEEMIRDEVVRLVQIRNPWGQRAPRTWKGDWGKDSAKWTTAIKKQIGVLNAQGHKMFDEMSVFWMSFEDVRQYFHTVEICRMHDTWETSWDQGWLTSGVGPGNAFRIDIYDRTAVDIVVWQEKHIKREASLNALSTNVDVGVAILKHIGTNPDGTPEYRCIEYASRTKWDFNSIECVLDGGFSYLIVPICFSQIKDIFPRKVRCVVHSQIAVEVEKMESSWTLISQTLWAIAKYQDNKSTIRPGVETYVIKEKGKDFGFTFLTENKSDEAYGVQYDCTASVGIVTTRTSPLTFDAVPPHHRQVIFAATVEQNAPSVQFEYGTQDVDPSMAEAMGLGGDIFHIPQKITELSTAKKTDIPPMKPDEKLLARGKILREARQKLDKELRAERESKEAALKAEEDKRKQAAEKDFAKEKEVAEAAAKTEVDAKARLQKKFEEYVKSGLSPNEAALKLLDEGKNTK